MKPTQRKIDPQYAAKLVGKKAGWFQWLRWTSQDNHSSALEEDRLIAGKQALLQYFERTNLPQLKLLAFKIQQVRTWNDLIQLRAYGYNQLARQYGEDTALQMLADFGKSQPPADVP